MTSTVNAGIGDSTPPPGGLRERKKRRTRRDLLRAAARLFAARGYDDTTVDDIAAAAGVSRRTLFRYFPTKESLAFPDTPTRLARFRGSLGPPLSGERPFGAVRRALLAMATEYMEDRDEIVARQRVIEGSPTLLAAERTFDLEWEAAIAEGLLLRTAGREDGEHWARMLAAAIFGVVRATIREWVADDGRSDLIAIGTASLDLLSAGFGLTVHSDARTTGPDA